MGIVGDLSEILFCFHVKAFWLVLTIVLLSIEWCCNYLFGEFRMIESVFDEINRIAREFDLSGLVNVSEINIGKVNHTCRADFLIDGWMHSYIV